MIATVGLVAPPDRPIRILEIGSWTGFSALTWTQAIDILAPQKGTLLCVDPWASYLSEADLQLKNTYESMDFMGRSGLAYDLFCHNIKFAPKEVRVDHFRGESANILPYLEKKSFDIVYVDGDHYYDGVLSDLNLAHELLRDGGVMCGDDLELQIGECDKEFAEQYKTMDYVEDPESGKKFHPGVALAVHEFFGRVSSSRGYWYMKKTPEGYQEMSLEGRTIFVPEHFPDAFKEHCYKVLFKRG